MAVGADTQDGTGERRCLHRDAGVEGRYFSGEGYVSALQLLRGEVAQRMARKVEPFFWQDAPMIRVWLCRDCQGELGVSG